MVFGSLVGGLGLSVANVGVVATPVAIYTVVYNISPVFTTILGFIFLGEKVGCFEAFCMLGSIGGIVLIGMS
jgi:drug/metabolite transporter (DMT)-like permease